MDNFNSMRDSSLLVDTGATAHILNEKSTFFKFDDKFKPEYHYMELVDGSRVNGIVSAKGRAKVLLHDLEGVPHHVFLEDALYIPSYKRNILPVQAAVTKGGAVNLNQIPLS